MGKDAAEMDWGTGEGGEGRWIRMDCRWDEVRIGKTWIGIRGGWEEVRIG